MRKIMLVAIMLCISSSLCFAGSVRGYTRSNGTYVSGYNRSSPNSTVRDNYSYKGQSNPYTGSTGSNHYRNSSSSEYYGTSPSPFTKKNYRYDE